MFTSEQLPELRRKIRAQAALEARVLDELVRQAAGLAAPHVRPIRPRTATAVALTAADGGNNSVAFNPFELQVIRVVDSLGKELFLDVVSPATDIDEPAAATGATAPSSGSSWTTWARSASATSPA